MNGLASDASYLVLAACPHCRETEGVMVTLTTLLKQTTTKSQISITMSQEPAMHVCGQLTLPDPQPPTDGEVLALPWVDADTGEIHEGAPA